MKRFVLCFALFIILALAVHPLTYSNAQDIAADSMEDTIWGVYVSAFDSDTGEFLYWFEDTFEFSGGTFYVYGLNDSAPYKEFEIPQVTIWLSQIGGGFYPYQPLFRFKGIRSSRNSNIIVGKVDSNLGVYFLFFGIQISAEEGISATPNDWGIVK